MSLALCAFADTDTAAEICLHLSSQLQCRCYYSPSADRLEQLPERYQALLECRRLRFFYPGQQVFFAPLPEETSGDPQLWETALTACISSAQTDKHLAFSQLMEKLKGESFENVLFALKRLDQMLEAALPPVGAACPCRWKICWLRRRSRHSQRLFPAPAGSPQPSAAGAEAQPRTGGRRADQSAAGTGLPATRA